MGRRHVFNELCLALFANWLIAAIGLAALLYMIF
jgi:hypothetical protein